MHADAKEPIYTPIVGKEVIDRNEARLTAILYEYGRGLITHAQFIGRLSLQQQWAMGEAGQEARLSELDDVRGLAVSAGDTQSVVEYATGRLETILKPKGQQ